MFRDICRTVLSATFVVHNLEQNYRKCDSFDTYVYLDQNGNISPGFMRNKLHLKFNVK